MRKATEERSRTLARDDDDATPAKPGSPDVGSLAALLGGVPLPSPSASAAALMRLGAATAEAVAKALDAICPAPVERGDVTVVPGDESPFDGFPFEDGPAVAVSVHYVDGVPPAATCC